MSITQTIDQPASVYPARTQAQNDFDAACAELMTKWPTFITQVNAWAGQANTLATLMNALAAAAAASQATAATSETNAAGSAAAAAAAANAAPWAAGVYALNACAISQIDFQTYRKITPSSATAVDPKNNPTNWVCISSAGAPAAAVVLNNQLYGVF